MVYPVRNKTKETPHGCLQQPVSNGVYLLIGQDIQAKEIQLKKIKQEFLPKELQDFNSDTLYAKDTTLKEIQERCLRLPLKSAKRVVVIKDAQSLDEDSRNFLSAYCKEAPKELVLVLDFEHYDYKDRFIKDMHACASIIRFRETANPDAFALARQIESRKADPALRLLSQLLNNGEAPERILGGLRFAWERQNIRDQESARRLKLLLACDIEIKTGRLKPACALEKLIVSLCCFAKPAR